jgi:predicted transporter
MGFGGIMTLRLYKITGNIAVPTLAAISLLIVAAQFSRSSMGEVSRLGLVLIALGIAVIGIAYYQLRRWLNQLDETTSDKALSKLCLAANSMAIFGYGICIGALTLILNR